MKASTGLRRNQQHPAPTSEGMLLPCASPGRRPGNGLALGMGPNKTKGEPNACVQMHAVPA
eukprot:5270335-Alexandrium_andersonii.AAC.1